jgi:hypothetical protein
MGKEVVFCCPTITKPYQPFLDSLAAALPVIQEAGWTDKSAWSIGCPYISRARSTMLAKAMKTSADVFVFLDHDLSFPPATLLKLLETDGDFIAGTYRLQARARRIYGLADHGRGG